MRCSSSGLSGPPARAPSALNATRQSPERFGALFVGHESPEKPSCCTRSALVRFSASTSFGFGLLDVRFLSPASPYKLLGTTLVWQAPIGPARGFGPILRRSNGRGHGGRHDRCWPL